MGHRRCPVRDGVDDVLKLAKNGGICPGYAGKRFAIRDVGKDYIVVH
jgi:hypothetical protein